MSSVKKLTFTAMIAALCTALLYLASLIPQLRLAVTALAGIFPAAVVIVCGFGWAAGCFAAAALLALLLVPDKSAALWFAFFFGHYPIWKSLIERYQTKTENPALGWTLKLIGFFVFLALLYFLFRDSFLGAIPQLASGWAIWALALALALCFVAYDIAFSILIGYFRIKILPKLK